VPQSVTPSYAIFDITEFQLSDNEYWGNLSCIVTWPWTYQESINDIMNRTHFVIWLIAWVIVSLVFRYN